MVQVNRADAREMAGEAVGQSLTCRAEMGLSPGTGDAVLIAYAVRRKGGNTVASKEEGGQEGGQESKEEVAKQ